MTGVKLERGTRLLEAPARAGPIAKGPLAVICISGRGGGGPPRPRPSPRPLPLPRSVGFGGAKGVATSSYGRDEV
jgi:hypothetical protein